MPTEVPGTDPGAQREPGIRFTLKYDLRAPSFGPDPAALYAACIEQCEAADRWGFERVFFAEHHGSEDRYCPAPVPVAAAVAARTKHIRLSPAALLAPLHDPLQVAEDLAVLDLVSGGRLDVILGAGYVADEFAMFGADLSHRGAAVSELIAVLKRAWSSERFDFRGRQVRVTPRPAQQPRPDIWLGGMSKAAAMRAAREADGFWPINPALTDAYLQERARLGLPAGSTAPAGYAVEPFVSPRFVFLSEDPERDWPRIMPHAVHEVASYTRMLTDAPGASRANVAPAYTQTGEDAWSPETIRKGGSYLVLTPEQCVDMYRPLAKVNGMVMLHPLLCGLDPDLSWNSLTLFAERVLPELRRA